MTITPSSRRWSSPVIRNTYALPSIYLTPNQRRGVESGSPVQCQVEAVHQESSLEEQFVSCVWHRFGQRGTTSQLPLPYQLPREGMDKAIQSLLPRSRQ